MGKKQRQLLQPQPRLGWGGTVLLISVLNMGGPLSTDMYLPALPTMGQYFHTTDSLLNLTLAGFFLFFAIGMLLFGALSDRYGRRPILLLGVSAYLLLSLGCAVAADIYVLIACRLAQGLSAGCMVSVSTAVVKDSFAEQERGTILAIIQAMSVIAPMVAPIIGALLLNWFSWRATFVLLGVLAALMLLLSLCLRETLPREQRTHDRLRHSFDGLWLVARNRAFYTFWPLTALLCVPFMAYISVNSYIYEDMFGLSATTYSYFFAANACFSMLGALGYIRVRRRLSTRTILNGLFVLALVAGVAMCLFGQLSPRAFLFSMIPFTIVSSMMRPLGVNLLLAQQERHTGAAASLINFGNTLFGFIGMMLATLNWSNYVVGLAVLMLVCSGLAAVGWVVLRRSRVRIIGL